MRLSHQFVTCKGGDIMKKLLLAAVVIAGLSFFTRQSLAVDYSGIWWEPALSGQGVTIHQEDNSIFGGWYLYDSSGLSDWLTFEGALSGNTLTTTFTRFTGPPFGGSWNPSQVVGTTTGSLILSFNSPNSATFAYSLDGSTGTLNLVRFGNKTQHLDGFYVGSSSPTAGSPSFCESSTVTLAIIDRVLRGLSIDTSGDVYVISATVGSDGSISGGVFQEIDLISQAGTVTGSVDGVTASGTWSDLPSVCSGTWSATAQ